MSIMYTFTCDKCGDEQHIETGDEFLKASEQKQYLFIFREDHQHADYEHLCQECIDEFEENDESHNEHTMPVL